MIWDVEIATEGRQIAETATRLPIKTCSQIPDPSLSYLYELLAFVWAVLLYPVFLVVYVPALQADSTLW